jgi:hypothetical protein
MPGNATAQSRLSDELNKRRVHLRLKWTEVAVRANISPAHLRSFRTTGAGLSDVAKADLEVALHWAPGSIDAILEGGTPTIALRISGEDRQPQRSDQTLGEMLVERGLLRPEELSASDDIRNDPVAWEIVEADDLSPEGRNRMLAAYAHMRREIYETVRQQRKPRE